MKKLTIIISKIMLVILTFTNVQSASAQQTAKQKIIGKELSAITAGVIQNLNDFNVKAVLKRYAKEVKSVNADGSINDYPSLYASLESMPQYLKSIKFTKIKEDFKFISNTTVLCTWIGIIDLENKNGGRMKINPHVSSILYSKMGNEWLIVYEHVSGATPVKMPEDKK